MHKQPFFTEAAEGQTSEPQQSYFVVTPSTVMDDDRLPDGAKLLYGLIVSYASKTGECFASTERLAGQCHTSPRNLRFWLEKLEKCGYIWREINREAAKAREPQRRIYITNPLSPARGAGKQLPAVPENNHRQSIINNNIPPYSPPKGEKESCFDFEAFWDMYGKKRGRAACEKKYARLNEATRQKIKDTLPRFLECHPNEQYLPYPLTYLNQRRWEDELPAAPAERTEEEILKELEEMCQR